LLDNGRLRDIRGLNITSDKGFSDVVSALFDSNDENASNTSIKAIADSLNS
jgi:hypothetical protein